MATEVIFPFPEAHELILDLNTSIVLPNFDTSSIIRDRVKEIVLSLFLLTRESELGGKILITINPFDPVTKLVENGLSAMIDPVTDSFIDFHLPRELFEKIVGTNKRLLIKLSNRNERLVFAGPEMSGTVKDPRLLIVYSNIAPQTQDAVPTHTINYIIGEMIYSQQYFGKGSKFAVGENQGLLTSLIVPVLVGILILLLWSFIEPFVKSAFPIVNENGEQTLNTRTNEPVPRVMNDK